MGSIVGGHLVDLTAMIMLVVIDITTELSVASLFASLGKSKPGTLMELKAIFIMLQILVLISGWYQASVHVVSQQHFLLYLYHCKREWLF